MDYWQCCRFGRSGKAVSSASVCPAANKSFQANKLITAFFEVSCEPMWVPFVMLRVGGPLVP